MTYLVTIGSTSFLIGNQMNLKEAKKTAQICKFNQGLKGRTTVVKLSPLETELFIITH